MSSRILGRDRKAGLCSATLLDRLTGLHPKAIDLSLERVERLLASLGNPERQLPPVIHVAGTNGKGSVIAFLRAIAEALGKRVHVYTSPHLVKFHERVVIGNDGGGAPISEDFLVACLLRAEAANGGAPITLFEITTAAAFVAFAEIPAELMLLETGLGGRLDATNVVAAPLVTTITSISLDHVSFLGDTVGAIAQEKAGILKPGVPCVVASQEREALEAIERKAASVDAPVFACGRDFDARTRADRLIFEWGCERLDLPLPNLAGRHQIDNAACAIATAKLAFGRELTVAALDRGLVRAKWPARLERLGHGGLHDYVKKRTGIWLDGGHNPAAARAIADVISGFDWQSGPLHLVWGMMETKDAGSFIAALRHRVAHVYTVPIPEEANAFTPAALAAIAIDQGLAATSADGVREALLLSAASKIAPARVLICGSLHLAGHVLKLHKTQAHPRQAWSAFGIQAIPSVTQEIVASDAAY